MRGRKPIGSVANGSPLSDTDLAECLRKERAMEAWNDHRLDEVPRDLVMFCGTMANFVPGEARAVSWERHLKLVHGTNLSLRRSKERPWQATLFPHTEEDLRRVISWRQANLVAK
jgi:hypothetical protein